MRDAQETIKGLLIEADRAEEEHGVAFFRDAATHIAVYSGLARHMQKLVGMPDVVFERHEAEARAKLKAALIVADASK